MKRLAENDLNHWLGSKRRKPLILRGARQVGKSTLVRNFCRENKIDLLEINLEKNPIRSFDNEGFSIRKTIQEIELTLKNTIGPNSLLFIDEIQAQPRAITALRYFYEDSPELPVIAAGSLLEVVLKQTKERISFPVGRVEFYQLGPMLFSEFLLNGGNAPLLEEFQKSDLTKTNEFAHRYLLEQYQIYLAVGGMPEAIARYFETKKLQEVSLVHQSILQTYSADFPKYGGATLIPKLQNTFLKIHHVVGNKLKYSMIDPDMKSRDLKASIDLLLSARVISGVTHSNCSGVPLSATEDDRIIKLYFLDVGLLNAALKTNLFHLIEGDELSTKGIIAEQFVAQHLLYREHAHLPLALHYWLRDKDTQKAEVDFAIEHHAQVIPIEVKSDSPSRLKSLLHFMSEKKTPLGVTFSQHPYSLRKFSEQLSDGKKALSVRGKILNLPLYQVEKLLNQIELNS